MNLIENLNELTCRNVILLLLVVVLLVATPIFILFDIFNLSQDEVAVASAGSVVSIGNQEITEREISMIRYISAGQEEEELLFSMHMYSEIRNMLLFQWAEKRELAPSDTETRTFIDEYGHASVPASHFEDMGISPEEYWVGIGFRLAQNLLTMERILEYLNENDPTTTHAMAQYQNFMALGHSLMQEWMLENPDLSIQFGLHEAAEILVMIGG